MLVKCVVRPPFLLTRHPGTDFQSDRCRLASLHVVVDEVARYLWYVPLRKVSSNVFSTTTGPHP